MLFNLLTDIIIKIYDILKYFVSMPDYRISQHSMEYFLKDTRPPMDIHDEFWEKESKEWESGVESYFVDVSDTDIKSSDNIPDNVSKTINRVKYWYNDKLYKYITYDTKVTWPPKETSGMTFNMPLISAHLIDQDDKPMKDVLNKIKRYAGPRGNFHGQEVKISDMLYYDIETLKKFYPKIKLKNVLGLTKIVSTTEDCITDLRIP